MTLTQDNCRAIGISFLKGSPVSELASAYDVTRRTIEGILRAQWRQLIDAHVPHDKPEALITAAMLRHGADIVMEPERLRELIRVAADRIEPIDRILTAQPEPHPEPVTTH